MDDKIAKLMGWFGMAVFLGMALYGFIARDDLLIFGGLTLSAILWLSRKAP